MQFGQWRHHCTGRQRDAVYNLYALHREVSASRLLILQKKLRRNRANTNSFVECNPADPFTRPDNVEHFGFSNPRPGLLYDLSSDDEFVTSSRKKPKFSAAYKPPK